MTTTRLSHLLAYAGVGVIVSYAAEWLLTHAGHGLLVPPWSLSIVLAVLSLAVLVAAWPVWRSAQRRNEESAVDAHPQDDHRRLVDPFYAVHVLGAARAASRTGAVLFGGGIGLLALVLLPPIPSLATVLPPALGATVASLILAICGYVAERACRLPPSRPQTPSDRLSGPGSAGATSLDRDAS